MKVALAVSDVTTDFFRLIVVAEATGEGKSYGLFTGKLGYAAYAAGSTAREMRCCDMAAQPERRSSVTRKTSTGGIRFDP